MGVSLARSPRRVRAYIPSSPPGPSARQALVLAAWLAAGFLPASTPWLAAARAAGPFPDAVTEFHAGIGGGFQQDLLPEIVLGGPRGSGLFTGSLDVVSLGDGGWITLAFDDPIVDGPGPDFTVFENAFLVPSGDSAGPPFAEAGRVAVSVDGVHFVDFPCALDDLAGLHAGCAGVYPVFANADDPAAPPATIPTAVPLSSLIGAPLPLEAPDGSGGDSFDLADVGLPAARFVRIVSGPGLLPNAGGRAGFDLDAVAAIHWKVATDTDGDGVDDVLDNCPATANEDQLDADGDGTGDVCDPCPAGGDPDLGCEVAPSGPDSDGHGDGDDAAPDHEGDAPAPDSDGDGIADGVDSCPTIANAAQADGDGDGIGNACDLCPEVGDPSNRDSDADGSGDACDPCPDDGSCGPPQSPTFTGGKGHGEAELLLSFVAPSKRVSRLASDALSVDIWITFGAAVDPATFRAKIGRADATALFGSITPGSSKRVTLPLGGRRTRMSFRIKGTSVTRKRARDRDRLVFRRAR